MRIGLSDERLRPLWAMEPLALAAFLCMIVLVGFNPTASPVLVIVALAGAAALLGAAIAGPWQPASDSAGRMLPGLLVAVVVSLALAVVSAAGLDALFEPQFAVPILVTAAAALVVWFVVARTEATPQFRWVATGFVLAAALTTGAVYLYSFTVPDLDVLAVLRSGADSLLAGDNPYVAARAPETNPFGTPGGEIEGYTYPPLVLYAYTVSQWLTGDPRWASIVAVAAVAVLIASPWTRPGREIAKARLPLALLFITAPAFGIITYFGWSEPLSLPFLLVAGRFWRSKPAVSAVALGLAVATKQYFILALPLLLFWPDEFRWKRVAIVSGTALATALPFLILDPVALWDSLTGLTAFAAEPRPDSLNLVNLGVVTPRWLATAVAIGVAVWLGWRGGEGFRFNLALAVVLSVAFILGVAAFRNYWYLIASMALIAVDNRYPFGLQRSETSPQAAVVAASNNGGL